MKNPFAKYIALLFMPLCLTAEDVATEPIGFNKVTCLTNSDTIVGVPLRQQGSIRAVLTAVPTVNGDSATLTVPTASLTLGALTGHYLKFIGGDRDGRWYDIQTATTGTANTASTLTISLNGDTLGAVTTGDQMLIAQYWTLDALFPPVGATTDWIETPVGSGNWVPNGHAIRSSSSNSSLARRTEILLPNLTSGGINLAPASVHFISGTTTKTWTEAKTGGLFAPSGTTILEPDAYFTIRHASSVTRPTIFRNVGEVEVDSISIALATSTTAKRDNQIALSRPIPLKLSDLGLAGTPAFISSSSVSLLARRDELLVYDNAVALKNRAPSVVYFVMGGNWQKMVNNVAVVANDDVLQAGYGIIIRKYKTATGQSVFWANYPTF